MSDDFDRKKCSCGSGQEKEAEYDARGIFLTYACTECRAVKLGSYRSEVLFDPNYWADEAIDEEGRTMTDEFDIGDQVLKHTGDYRIPGEIRSKFQLYDGGPVRYVVRHEAVGGGHFCHIYAPANLRRLVEW